MQTIRSMMPLNALLDCVNAFHDSWHGWIGWWHGFFENETSVIVDSDTTVRFEHTNADGKTTVLKKEFKLIKGEVLDFAFNHVAELRVYFANEIEDCKCHGIHFFLHWSVCFSLL